MVILNILIIIFLFAAIIICYLQSRNCIQDLDKKEHKFYLIYPFAEWLISKSKMDKWFKQSEHKEEMLTALYGNSKKELTQRLYWCNRISTVVVIIILFNVLSLLTLLSNTGSSIINGNYVKRPNQGEVSKNVKLNVTLEKTDGDGNSVEESSPDSKDVNIIVQPQEYTPAELEQLFSKAYTYLQGHILGANSSLEEISSNLNFIKQIPGTGILVDWQPDDYSLIQSDGAIRNDNMKAEGETTSVTAVLSLQKEEREYVWKFKILPKKYSKDQLLAKKLAEKIKSNSQDTLAKDYLLLPNELEEYQLNWKDIKRSSPINWLLLGVIGSIIAWILADKELEGQIKKRKEQMELDYPEIVNKFTLLVNAGMTIKQAWNKIIEDYKDKLNPKRSHRRFAYEEMITTMNELKLGKPEQIAYEQFGRRIGAICYIKFSSLIAQNLKKGTRGFTDLLMKEAVDAFEIRKQTAKRLGEEAGTKLLLPMMLLLIIVFLIIMIPAYWSFKG